MKKIVNIFIFIWLCLQPLAAIDEKEITPVMTDKIHQVVALLKDKSLKQKEREQKILAIVNPVFDFALMAKLSLGKKQWSKLTQNEQDTFINIFGDRIRRSYLEKTNLYTDEGIEVKKAEKVKSSRIHLESYLIMPQEKREITYKFYPLKNGDWLIYDVDIFGVSVVQTYRSQLDGVLEKESFEALLQRLNTK